MTEALPHSEPLEAALVARLLVDPAQLPVIAGKLEPEDFYVRPWRRLFAAMQRLSEDKRTVDLESLRMEVGEEADDLSRRLGEITAAHRAPLEEYAVMIRDFAFQRRLISTLEGFLGRAYGKVDRQVLLSELHEAIQQVAANVEDGNLMTPGQAVDAYMEVMAERARGERRGLSWGIEALDEFLLPARGGEMIIVAARPSIGKTVLAEQVAAHWAALSRLPVLFASLEMPVESLLDRTVARITGIAGTDVIRGVLTDTQAAKVQEALDSRRHLGVWYLDDSYATTGAIRAAAARVRMLTGGLSAIVVDYLGLLKDHHESEVTRVTRISRQLKAIAREFNVPLLALSQLNRGPESREDSHPRLQDLRDSGALEQDADRVLGLWRPDRASAIADLDVLKSRQGPTGRIYLGYDGEHFRFVEREAVHEEADDTELDDDFEHFA